MHSSNVLVWLLAVTAVQNIPPYSLRAEWATAQCVLPAKFRVTLTNESSAPFRVPSINEMGNGRPINFVAHRTQGNFEFTGGQSFSSEYFFTSPFTPEKIAVLLKPGESHTYDLEFDGLCLSG